MIVALAVATACAPPPGRPVTSAKLAVLSPTSGPPIAGTDVVVQLRLTGAKIASDTRSGELRPDRGHVHLLVDGEPVLMSYSLRAVLPQLAPGAHTIKAEFVATDHAPFSNQVSAAVTVKVS